MLHRKNVIFILNAIFYSDIFCISVVYLIILELIKKKSNCIKNNYFNQIYSNQKHFKLLENILELKLKN